MSRDTENAMKQAMEFLAAHEDEIQTEEDANRLLQEFVQQYNSGAIPLRPSQPETADDYLELAEEAKTKKAAMGYLKKALELEPDNLDALLMQAQRNAKSPMDLVLSLPPIIQKGDALMLQEGHFRDDMGDFWGVLETRPYMRVRYSYLQALKNSGMMRKAVAEGERLMELCEEDNLGVRYDLIFLYAYLEDEEKALALFNASEYSKDESQMLLALSILYFKLDQLDTSLDYLKKLRKCNKDTKKFLRLVCRGDEEEIFAAGGSGFGYQPYTIEELVTAFQENVFLLTSVMNYFQWANKQLKN
ncbi:MAG: hypothetical protein LUF80_03475 [Oscillospiraceae bacterium]|nr:hypothetical protein [Oscillospiraceae bacterium]